jgi:hypothetical protein
MRDGTIWLRWDRLAPLAPQFSFAHPSVHNLEPRLDGQDCHAS